MTDSQKATPPFSLPLPPVPLVCCTGPDSTVSIYPRTLDETSSARLEPIARIGITKKEYRGTYPKIITVPTHRADRVVAVSRMSSPFGVFLVDLENGMLDVVYSGHDRPTWGMAVISESPTLPSRIATGGDGNGRVIIFDAKSGLRLLTIKKGLPNYVYSVLHVSEWNCPNLFVSSSGSDGKVVQIDVEGGVVIREGSQNPGAGFGLACSKSRGLLFSTSYASQVGVWSGRELEMLYHLDLKGGSLSCAYEEESCQLVVGCYSGAVEVWDLRNVRQKLAYHQSLVEERNVMDLAFLGGSRYALSGGRALSYVDVARGKVLAVDSMNTSVYSVCISTGDEFYSGDQPLLLEERIDFFCSFDMVRLAVLRIGGICDVRMPEWCLLTRDVD